MINDVVCTTEYCWKYVDDLSILEPPTEQSHVDSLVDRCRDDVMLQDAMKCKGMKIDILRGASCLPHLKIVGVALEVVSSRFGVTCIHPVNVSQFTLNVLPF